MSRYKHVNPQAANKVVSRGARAK